MKRLFMAAVALLMVSVAAIAQVTTSSLSGKVTEGDANGDDKVNVVDIVHLVNAKASQSEIDKVVKILMGK